MWHIPTDIFQQESPSDKFIKVNKLYFDLYKKEQKILKETKEFEDSHKMISNFDYLFYDFQIFCEFIEKNKNNFNLQYSWEFYDLLDNFSLIMRFLKTWYYESCWIYIRKTFEDWVKMFSKDKNMKKWLGQIINSKVSDIWPMIFNTDEVYKLYNYLSNKYTHHHRNINDIKFDMDKYLEIEWLSVMIIITICCITVQLVEYDEIEEHRCDKIDNPVEEYTQYCNYIWPLISSALFSWCHSWFESSYYYTNIKNYEFINWEKWLDFNKWIYNYKELNNFNWKDIKNESRN